MTDEQIQSIAHMTAQCIKEFYKDPNHLKQFEEWLKLFNSSKDDKKN